MSEPIELPLDDESTVEGLTETITETLAELVERHGHETAAIGVAEAIIDAGSRAGLTLDTAVTMFEAVEKILGYYARIGVRLEQGPNDATADKERIYRGTTDG